MKKAGFKKYDSAYKRAESPFTKYVSDAQRKAIWASCLLYTSPSPRD